MQIVIDIPEEDYEYLKSHNKNGLYNAILKGTPLPKGHALEQKLNGDAISRRAVLEQTYNWSKDEFLRVTNPFDYLRKRIKALPSVNPQPKTGHWIDVFGGCECSECGCLEGGYSDYCPNCGIKMIDKTLISEPIKRKGLKDILEDDPSLTEKISIEEFEARTGRKFTSEGDECVDETLMPLIDERYEPDIRTEFKEAGNEND